MAEMHYRPSPSGGGHIFIATPTGSAPKAEYTYSLGRTMKGGNYEYALYAGDCHVDDARNKMVALFLETDCTELVFIDDDIGWEPEALERLCSYDVDVVGASYPYKTDEEDYPVAFLGGGGDLVANEMGLIEVGGVPTGFLRIKRHVLETLASKAGKYYDRHTPDKAIPVIFERQLVGTSRRGGDYAFCYKWRQAGGKVFFDPEISLNHTGNRTWPGSWGHFKRVELYGAVKAGLLEISEGAENVRTCPDMVAEWGNKHSADATLLEAAVKLARVQKRPILEFGSGLTTLAMAAATDQVITSLEHDDKWLELSMNAALTCGLQNIDFVRSPLKDGFYNVIPDEDWGLILMDGPPRDDSNRDLFYDHDWGDAVVIMDDLDDLNTIKTFLEWSERNGRKAEITGHVGISRRAH